MLREKFFAQRRAGRAVGQLGPDLDTELAIDLLFGPIVFRLFIGIQPLDADGASALARMGLRAIVPDHD